MLHSSAGRQWKSLHLFLWGESQSTINRLSAISKESVAQARSLDLGSTG